MGTKRSVQLLCQRLVTLKAKQDKVDDEYNEIVVELRESMRAGERAKVSGGNVLCVEERRIEWDVPALLKILSREQVDALLPRRPEGAKLRAMLECPKFARIARKAYESEYGKRINVTLSK